LASAKNAISISSLPKLKPNKKTQKGTKKRQTKLSALSSFRYSSPANFFAARMAPVKTAFIFSIDV